MSAGVRTTSVRMEPLWAVSFGSPEEDAERLLVEVASLDPLQVGASYDSDAFQSAAGVERHRPLVGAAAGAESKARARPGVVEVAFHIRRDPTLLEHLVDRLFSVHPYQEPIIEVKEVLVSRSRVLTIAKIRTAGGTRKATGKRTPRHDQSRMPADWWSSNRWAAPAPNSCLSTHRDVLIPA
jgi:hypothetical protein